MYGQLDNVCSLLLGSGGNRNNIEYQLPCNFVFYVPFQSYKFEI